MPPRRQSRRERDSLVSSKHIQEVLPGSIIGNNLMDLVINTNNNISVIDNNIDAANRIVGRRVGTKSITNYRGKMNTIKAYLLQEGHQDCIDSSGNVIVPLSSDIIRGLFGWLSTNTDLPKKKKKKGCCNYLLLTT